MCVWDSNVARKMHQWTSCYGSKHRGKIGHIQKTLHSSLEEKRLHISSPRLTTVRNTFSGEHNQEADHLANMGAKGQRKITVEKGNNFENWNGGCSASGRATKRQTVEVDVELRSKEWT